MRLDRYEGDYIDGKRHIRGFCTMGCSFGKQSAAVEAAPDAKLVILGAADAKVVIRILGNM